MRSVMLGLTSIVFLGACAEVIGTDDVEECEVDTCTASASGAGGAGGDTTSSTGSGGAGGAGGTGAGGAGGSGGTGGATTASTTVSTGTGATCVDVTMAVSGSVKVELDPDHIDFEADTPGPFCLRTGEKTLVAECDASGGNDPPALVTWGNPLCTDGESTCTFLLEQAETFTVVGADCP